MLQRTLQSNEQAPHHVSCNANAIKLRHRTHTGRAGGALSLRAFVLTFAGNDPYPAEGTPGCEQQKSAQCPSECERLVVSWRR